MHVPVVIGRTFGDMDVAEKPTWTYSRRVRASTAGAVACHERDGKLGDEN